MLSGKLETQKLAQARLGEETLAALRQLPATRDCPAIFVTAKAQTREAQDLLEANEADGVILKPFDPTVLPDEIRAIWEKSSAG